MASAGARGTRASSSEHTRAAARYLDTEAASLTDFDDGIIDLYNDDNTDAEGAAAWRPAAAETTKRHASRPASHGASHRQPSLHDRGVRSNPVISRRDSSEGSLWLQPEAGAAAYGGLAPLLQHSTGSSINRRHPNGLPARQTAGPLPGMPFLSELVSRYPVRNAPASGPQISLVSGQLYVSDRLRGAMTTKKSTAPVAQPPPASSSATPTHGHGFPTPEMLIPAYAVDQAFPPSSYMQQRRAEKEQRAMYTGQQQQPSSRASWGLDATGPGHGCTTLGQLPAGRVASATTGTNARNGGGGGGGGAGGGGGGGGGAGGNSRQRDALEGVERWLETNDNSGGGEQDAAGSYGRPKARQQDSSSDPSLVYRQYGIFRTYGRQTQGLWPSLSMPLIQQQRGGGGGGGGGGHRVVFDQKRSSSGVGGSSPMRPSTQHTTSTFAPPRQSAW